MNNGTNHDDLQLRPVRRNDWVWIKEWFQDEHLSNELGPIDETWLEHVIGESDGIELVAEECGVPVALIGVLWGTKTHPDHVVTKKMIENFSATSSFF